MLEYDFKRPQLEDKEIISHYFKHHTSRSCERTFVNVFLWARFYGVTYAIIENTLVFKSENEDGFAFAYPAGEAADVKKALDVLCQYSEERSVPFRLYNVTPDNFEQIEAWYPATCTSRRSSVHWQGKSCTERETISINLNLFTRGAGTMRPCRTTIWRSASRWL